jgi:hypothetical protein
MAALALALIPQPPPLAIMTLRPTGLALVQASEEKVKG